MKDNREMLKRLDINLCKSDAEMTDAQTNPETEEAHVTLTIEPPVVQLQSSYASSDLVAKFINPSPDTGIDSILNLNAAVSVKDMVDVAVQLKSDKLREEAQAENQEFLNSLDSNMKRIIKEQVKAQTSKIMTKVEKYVTETLGAKVLVRSTNQPQTYYAERESSTKRYSVSDYSDKDLLSSYGEVVTLKRGRDDQDKDEEPSARSNLGSKRQRLGKERSDRQPLERKKVNEELGKVHWWEIIRRRPTAATKDHMISSYDVLIIQNIRVISFTMKMEILLESTSNKLMVEHAEFDESNTHVLERFYTSAGNPVKEILLKLNLPDHRILKDGGEVKEFQRSFRHSDTERLSRSDEVLKLKNFKKDATLKLFKSTNQERYEHVGPKSQVSQDGKVH
ncbi:hypothetical protein Tco_0738947 [Tanacetum coccineum]